MAKQVMEVRHGGANPPKVKAPPEQKKTLHTRAELEKLKIDKLQMIGKQFGVTDTDRKELVNGILTAQEKGASLA